MPGRHDSRFSPDRCHPVWDASRFGRAIENRNRRPGMVLFYALTCRFVSAVGDDGPLGSSAPHEEKMLESVGANRRGRRR